MNQDPVVVVGCGASGVHFTSSLLDKGYQVVLLDVGHAGEQPPMPESSFDELKARLDDPVQYFLGDNFESMVAPDADGEYYGFPPSKKYVFRRAPELKLRSNGFSPLLSFARGGLAQAWTGGCYPFSDDDLAEFPFGYRELAPWYSTIAKRIGVSGTADDLQQFLPVHDGLQQPVELDEHSRCLLECYDQNKASLNQRYRCFLGRARTANLSAPMEDRSACNHCGRCLWGCPTQSFYTPAITLRKILGHPNLRYLSGHYVTHFEYDDQGRVTQLVTRSRQEQAVFRVGALVLAAGTLCSSKIYMDSIYQRTGQIPRLHGLMDNRQIMMPFVNRKLIGCVPDRSHYQYHQLAFALAADDPRDNIHALVTTLSTALVHPLVQRIPTSLRTALRVFRNVRAGLGLLNVNLADRRSERNWLTLEPCGTDGQTRLVIQYVPHRDDRKRITSAVRRVRKVLRKLKCIAPKRMTHIRPMGAGVHYAGTVPSIEESARPTTDSVGRCRDFENLYFADATTFPSLPAKNLTFTLMANAARIASLAF